MIPRSRRLDHPACADVGHREASGFARDYSLALLRSQRPGILRSRCQSPAAFLISTDRSDLTERLYVIHVSAERRIIRQFMVNSIGPTSAGVGTEPKSFPAMRLTS